jgi:Raf kinase inhibitor-like YbhB/YbcL family protein
MNTGGSVRTPVFFLVFSLVFFPLFSDEKSMEEKNMDLKVTSSAFQQGGMIPAQYTCDGADTSPPIAWSKGPGATKSYALIADDPDAPMGTWVHWVMYNIPPNVVSLKEGLSHNEKLDNGAVQGTSSFGKIGYGGPCPPSGTHRYYFKIYALDTTIAGGPGLTKKQLLKEMEKHIIAQGELMGRYSH